MSYYDDDTTDYAGMNSCQDILYHYSHRYGRFGGQIKEKYGTIRFYAVFNDQSLHGLIFPGYCYKHKNYPNWLWSLDIYYISEFIGKVFGRPLFWWRKQVYNYAYQQCLKKHPNLRRELLSSADYPELIKGATRFEEDDKERRTIILGWNGEEIGRWTSTK
jgi:hypothetical protein